MKGAACLVSWSTGLLFTLLGFLRLHGLGERGLGVLLDLLFCDELSGNSTLVHFLRRHDCLLARAGRSYADSISSKHQNKKCLQTIYVDISLLIGG